MERGCCQNSGAGEASCRVACASEGRGMAGAQILRRNRTWWGLRRALQHVLGWPGFVALWAALTSCNALVCPVGCSEAVAWGQGAHWKLEAGAGCRVLLQGLMGTEKWQIPFSPPKSLVSLINRSNRKSRRAWQILQSPSPEAELERWQGGEVTGEQRAQSITVG